MKVIIRRIGKIEDLDCETIEDDGIYDVQIVIGGKTYCVSENGEWLYVAVEQGRLQLSPVVGGHDAVRMR